MSRAWVIGGRRGIGRVITLELEKYGAFVMASDETTIDVGSHSQIQEAYLSFRPEQIVYCAGINRLMPLTAFSDMNAVNIMDINVIGFMRVMANVASNTGITDSVVAVCSDAATHPMRNSIAYCASKAALSMAVRCAARELAPLVRVNAVSPGIVAGTHMTRYTDLASATLSGRTRDEEQAYEESRIPMKRRATVDEVAQLVRTTLYGPAYQTGSIIEINGGR